LAFFILRQQNGSKEDGSQETSSKGRDEKGVVLLSKIKEAGFGQVC